MLYYYLYTIDFYKNHAFVLFGIVLHLQNFHKVENAITHHIQLDMNYLHKNPNGIVYQFLVKHK